MPSEKKLQKRITELEDEKTQWEKRARHRHSQYESQYAENQQTQAKYEDGGVIQVADFDWKEWEDSFWEHYCERILKEYHPLPNLDNDTKVVWWDEDCECE